MTDSATIAQSFVINNKQVDQFGYRALLIKNTNGSKAQFGFTTYLQRFTVFEGLFSKFMYCEGQIYDGASFVQKVGIQSGDIIRISLYKDPDDEEKDTITNDFYIESLGAGTRLVGGKGQIFTFRAVSKVGVVGLRTKIKRSFSGKASDIVNNLCEKFFELEPNKVKPENIEETFGEIKINSSSLNPFEFIERLNVHSVSASNKAGDNNFFFYETRDGIIYKSLRKIVQDANTFNYIVPVDKNRDQKSEANDYFRIEEFEIKVFNDQRTKVEQGVFENQTLTFDFIARNIEKKTFLLKDSYKDVLLLGNNLAFDTDEIDHLVGKQETITDDDQHIFTRCSSKAYDQPEDYVTLKKGPSQAQYVLMNQTVVSCRILGNPKLKPGDIVNIKAAQPSSSDDKEYDIFLTGNFLVGSARHVVLDATSYETVIDLFKDGYEFDISNYRRDTNSNLTQAKQ